MKVAQKAILKFRFDLKVAYFDNNSTAISDIFTALDNWAEKKVDVNLRSFWVFPDSSVLEFVPKTRLLKYVKSLDAVALMIGREYLGLHPYVDIR